MSKIIFMGTPDFSTKVLEMLIAEHDVIAVVTQPDRPVGRKRTLTPPPVKKVAVEHDIAVYQPEKLAQSEDLKVLIDLNFRHPSPCKQQAMVISREYGYISVLLIVSNQFSRLHD